MLGRVDKRSSPKKVADGGPEFIGENTIARVLLAEVILPNIHKHKRALNTEEERESTNTLHQTSGGQKFATPQEVKFEENLNVRTSRFMPAVRPPRPPISMLARS